MVDVPWARKGSGFTLSFEAMVTMLSQGMPVSSVARIVQIHEDPVWRILKHYVYEAGEQEDLSDLKVIGIDEFPVEKHHVYVTLLYSMRNSRVIHIEEGRESDVSGKFIMKHPFLDSKNIDHIAMDMSPSYISGAEQYLPDSAIVFDHFPSMKK